MIDSAISVITGTASDDALHGPCEVWGVTVAGSISVTAVVQLHNNVSFTGTVLVQVQTNPVGNTATPRFELLQTTMFPRPIRFNRALSVTADDNVGRYWIYIGGRGGASV